MHFLTYRISFVILISGLFNLISYAQTPDISQLEKAVGIVERYDYKGGFIGHGSGFVIKSDGTLVTNYHVIDGAYSLKLVLEENGRRVKFDVQNIVKGSKSKDLAILKIRNTQNKLFSYLKIAQYSPQKGEECWAIGTPASREFMNTVSKGLVSNLDFFGSPKMIQTNAGIAHGSSGGALINQRGEVIGVTSGGYGTEDGSRAGINFAIWIDEIKTLPIINKKKIIKPESIPCEISFYTKNRFDGDLYLYVDGNYIGVIKKYFINSIPTCGDEGTISKTLYSGEHSYRVYSRNRGRYIYGGRVNISPGECKIFNVSTHTATNYPNVNINRNSGNKKSSSIKNDKKGLFDLRLFSYISGSSPYSANGHDGWPLFAFGIDKEINSNLSIQIKYQNLSPYTSTNVEQDIDGNNIDNREYRYYDINNDFNSFMIDMKIYENGNDESSVWFGPSLALISLKKTEIWYPASSGTGFPITGGEEIIDYPLKWGIGYGIRGGFDKFLTKRIVFSTDIVLMKCTKNVIDLARYDGYVIKPKAAGLNINLGLGFRFGKVD